MVDEPFVVFVDASVLLLGLAEAACPLEMIKWVHDDEKEALRKDHQPESLFQYCKLCLWCGWVQFYFRVDGMGCYLPLGGCAGGLHTHLLLLCRFRCTRHLRIRVFLAC